MPERPLPSDPFALCGTTLADKYRIVSVVGSGGFGVVYRGVHTGFAEPIAVKCLKLPGELDVAQREKLLARLQDEGRVLHRLSRLSPAIVQALDVGAMTTAGGQWVPFLVLEWLEGQTLSEHVKERKKAGDARMALAAAVELLEPAARGLALAHEQKVAHRDVKPDNLVITEVSGHRTVKILDFGIAKVLAQHTEFTAAPAATQRAPTAFTPSYGAPEQFNKKRGATGPWTDVFALALILVELVTGERALDGDDATQLYIAAADPAARPTLRFHGVSASDAVEQVLQRALAVDPHDRFPDAGAFWNALREAMRGADARPMTPAPADVSETGEFVSRNAIGLEPEALSRIDRQLGGSAAGEDAAASPQADGSPAATREQTTASRAKAPETGAVAGSGGAAPDDGSTERSPMAPREEPAQAGTDAASARSGLASGAKAASRPQPPSGSATTRDEAPAAGTGPVHSTLRSAGAARRAVAADFPTQQPDVSTDTLAPSTEREPRRSWWMPLLALAALAGAAALYWQLTQGEDGGPKGGTPSSTRGSRPATTRPGTGPRSSATASASGAPGGDAGGQPDGGAPPDGGSDDGGAGRFPPPPEGMAFIPGGDGSTGPVAGFFLDKTETTTAAYRECVLAGRCVRASRVVLTEEVANRIWGKAGTDPNEPTMTPEELAKAWGKRCNEVRGALDHPINCVNHASAEDYCRWKGRRLPSSEEWTLAAGRGNRRHPWGSDAPSCAAACFGLNGSCQAGTQEVASCSVGSHERDRTPEGVLDLGGNVAEWVADEVPAAGPQQPALNLARGGSFADEANRLAATTSESLPPITAHVTLGFRCAANAPEGYVTPP